MKKSKLELCEECFWLPEIQQQLQPPEGSTGHLKQDSIMPRPSSQQLQGLSNKMWCPTKAALLLSVSSG